MILEKRIGQILSDAGIEKFGFVSKVLYDDKAPSQHRISDLLATAQSALVYILPLNRHIVDRFPQDFTGDAYDTYAEEKKTVSEKLASVGERLAATFKENGFDAIVVPKGSRDYMGWISLKHLSCYAGLGVLGRNSLLLNPEYGPCFRISAVLTDYDPTSFNTFIDGKRVCEECNSCITNCPAHALEIPGEGEIYSISKEKCHKYFCEMRGIEYNSENANVNCGLCMRVCPVGDR
ncbi:MAG: hypothetical protein HXS44_04670 [Theionarchaea archaeon]|nr:hypothetical protein [Theionarchaea archaeon]